MSDHKHEVDRVAHLMREIAESSYEEADRVGWENFRFETVGIIGIAAWTDADGDEVEDVFMAFETKRHHVRTGILTDALAVQLKRRNRE